MFMIFGWLVALFSLLGLITFGFLAAVKKVRWSLFFLILAIIILFGCLFVFWPGFWMMPWWGWRHMPMWWMMR